MGKKFNATNWADTLKGLIDNPETLEQAVSVGFVEQITIEPVNTSTTKGKKKGVAQIIEESEEPEPHDVGMGEIHIEY